MDPQPIRIFCSYAHADEAFRKALGKHTASMRLQGLTAEWHDRMIPAGDDWDRVIKAELENADIILLMISADFIASSYCGGVEVKRAMERYDAGSAVVIPIFARPCDITDIRFASLQGAPADLKWVTTWGNRDKAYLSIAEAIRKRAVELIATRAAPESTAVVDVARVPTASGPLFGRDAMFAQLDHAWAQPDTAILTVVAQGGMGKSVLVSRWLDGLKDRRWDGAAKVYGWSFYSQGSDRQASADDFLDAALTHFAFAGERPISAWDKGVALAELMKREKCLLVLDGLEPLQYRDSEGVGAGRLKDQGLQGLLRTLARRGHPGLCLITTRQAVADLGRWEEEGRAVRLDLGRLGDDAGADLLAALGVVGTLKRLRDLAHDFAGHALALTVLAAWLKESHGGNPDAAAIRPTRKAAGNDDQAIRVLEAVTATLAPAEAALLALLGLFDRPAVPLLLDALRADPPIPGLTDALAGADWPALLISLRRRRLVLAEEHDGALDAHPLVREFFGARLKTTQPQAWATAHSRLFDTLCASAPDQPDTLEAMAPLFQAIRHGSEAGRQREALDDVVRARIDRRNEFFAGHRLGAVGARLAALAALFEAPWSRPAAALTEAAQSFLLNDAGYGLRAVGHPADAVALLQAGLGARKAQEDWKNAAIAAANLSEVLVVTGVLAEAVAKAERAVASADRCRDNFQQIVSRTSLADAFAQSGRTAEAAAAFVEAEAMQAKRQPSYPILTSLQGFQYCDLLLDGGDWSGVRQRAAQAREVATRNGWLLDIALDTLSLGRAAVLAARAGQGGWDEAAGLLDEAVASLRRAGSLDDLPRGLLARAALRLERGPLDLAAEDIDEAREIAEAGGMRLFLADVLLAEARLALAEHREPAARAHLDEAKALIDEMGYHRRDRDVAELERRLRQR